MNDETNSGEPTPLFQPLPLPLYKLIFDNHAQTTPPPPSPFSGILSPPFTQHSSHLAAEDLRSALKTREDEISSLKKNIQSQSEDLGKLTSESQEYKDKVTSLQRDIDQLQTTQRLDFILSRVNSQIKNEILKSSVLQEQFKTGSRCNAFVISVDLRRSTELMLKARSERDFALFINELTSTLFSIITQNHGVFDKFTGDGILAFFPDFLSKESSALYVAKSAFEAHAAFDSLYKRSRNKFKSILANIGLGVGVDYGEVELLELCGGLTVIGEPVVYACRLGSAPAGHTYVNQPAFEVIQKLCGEFCHSADVILPIKHEGDLQAYSISPTSYQAIPKSAD